MTPGDNRIPLKLLQFKAGSFFPRAGNIAGYVLMIPALLAAYNGSIIGIIFFIAALYLHLPGQDLS